MHPTASSALVALFIPLPVVVALALAFGWWKATRASFLKAFAFVTAWFLAMTALGASGALNHWDTRPPPLMILFVVLMTTTVTLSLSSIGKRSATASRSRH